MPGHTVGRDGGTHRRAGETSRIPPAPKNIRVSEESTSCPRLSIIVITLNEEKYLPRLLRSIERQSFRDYEVIVADAGSTDATVRIARQHKARVVRGGRPAEGRNSGARYAGGDILLFLDADVRLPARFLENALREMDARFLDLATCDMRPLSSLLIDRLLHDFANVYVRLSQRKDPHATGSCIFITRRLFERIGGFDEALTMAEDHDLVKRASVFRPLAVLESTHILMSVRRLTKEGRLGIADKYLRVEMARLLGKDIREAVIEYEFGAYGKASRSEAERRLLSIDRKVAKIHKDVQRFMQSPKEGRTMRSFQLRLRAQMDTLRKMLPKNRR